MKNKIIEFGAIVEIRIPNKILLKKKTERAKNLLIRNAVMNFLNIGLKKIGKFDVYYVNGLDTGYDGEELCEINDFNYSVNNKVKKNTTCTTFRFFGCKIMSIVPIDTELTNNEKFILPPINAHTISKFKGNEFFIMTSMFAEHKNKNM